VNGEISPIPENNAYPTFFGHRNTPRQVLYDLLGGSLLNFTFDMYFFLFH